MECLLDRGYLRRKKRGKENYVGDTSRGVAEGIGLVKL